MRELKGRRKVRGFSSGKLDPRLLDEMARSADERQKLADHFRQICKLDSATLKTLLRFDLSLILDYGKMKKTGYCADAAFNCLDEILPSADITNHAHFDWWNKLQQAVLMDVYESDIRLSLISPNVTVLSSVTIMKILKHLLGPASSRNLFLLGIVWLNKAIVCIEKGKDSFLWFEKLKPLVHEIFLFIVPRLDFEPDPDMRILIGQLFAEYYVRLGGSEGVSFEFFSPIVRRLSDSNTFVQEEFVQIIASSLIAFEFPEHSPVAPEFSISHQLKILIMACPNIDTFKSLHFESILKTLGIFPQQRPKTEVRSEILRSLQPYIGYSLSSLEQITGLCVTEEVQVFWGLWECARFCVSSRLHTPFGGPEQTLNVLESLFSTDFKGTSELRHLVLFVEMLELQIANAVFGSVSFLAPTSKQSTAFFIANQKVCKEWFNRVRSKIATGRSRCIGMIDSTFVIRHSLERLDDTTSTKHQMDDTLPALGAALVEMDDVDSLSGLSRWIGHRVGFKKINSNSLEGLKLMASGMYEAAFDAVDSDFFSSSTGASELIFPWKAFFDSKGLTQEVANENRKSGFELRKWDVLDESEVKKLRNSSAQGLSKPFGTNIITLADVALENADGNLPIVWTKMSFDTDEPETVSKVLNIFQVALFERKRVTNIRVTIGKRGRLENIHPRFLPLATTILQSDVLSGQPDVRERVCILVRKTARKYALTEFAKRFQSAFGDKSLDERMEIAKFEWFVLHDYTAAIRTLIDKVFCGGDMQITSVQKSKAALLCFKFLKSGKIAGKELTRTKQQLMLIFGERMENDHPSFSETCLKFATSSSQDYGKAWFTAGTYFFKEAAAMVEELESKNPAQHTLQIFQKIHQRAEHSLSFTDLLKKLCPLILNEETEDGDSMLGKHFEMDFSEENIQFVLETLRGVKEQLKSLVRQSVRSFFAFLKSADSINKPERKSIAVSRLIFMLTSYGQYAYDEFQIGLSTTPLEPWMKMSLHLFGNLEHSNAAVCKMMELILCRIAKSDSHVALVPALVRSRSSKVQGSEHVLNRVLSWLKPEDVNNAKALLEELERVAVLWDELWINALGHWYPEATKRLNQFSAEYSRHRTGEVTVQRSKLTLNEKYSILMHPVIEALESLFNETIGSKASSPHEQLFVSVYELKIARALGALKCPIDLSVAKKLWDPFFEIAGALAKTISQDRNLSLNDLSPRLVHTAKLSIPLPSGATLVGIYTTVKVLPTKTKPKKITLDLSNGTHKPFLLKGHEDLRLDERIQSFFAMSNELLKGRKETRSRNLSIRCFQVTPLGDNFGMIEWIDNLHQLFSFHKHWQVHDHESRQVLGKEVAILRPHELFNSKLVSALKRKGLPRNTPRRDWPDDVLMNVFRELSNETPKNLIKNELWFSSVSTIEWWRKTNSFARSLGVSSMLSYIIGLGDRHLDNILLDLRNGDVMHIDFNICFERGRRLRVPETVPFRLTQNLVSALGSIGLEGSFRIACETAIGLLRDNVDVIESVFSSLMYDPLCDWIASENHSEKLNNLKLDVKFLCNRIFENCEHISSSLKKISNETAHATIRMDNFAALNSLKLQLESKIVDISEETGTTDEIFEQQSSDIIEQLKEESGRWISRIQRVFSTMDHWFLEQGFERPRRRSSGELANSIINFDDAVTKFMKLKDMRMDSFIVHLNTYHKLISPISEKILRQSLHRRISVELAELARSTYITNLRSLIRTETPSEQTRDQYFKMKSREREKLESVKNMKLKIKSLSEAIQSTDFSATVGEICRSINAKADVNQFAPALFCCVVIKCSEYVGDVILSLLRSHHTQSDPLFEEITEIREECLVFSEVEECIREPISSTFVVLAFVSSWSQIVTGLGMGMSDSFEREILNPLKSMSLLADILKGFSRSLHTAILETLQLLGSFDGSVDALITQLDGICLRVSMAGDPKSHEYLSRMGSLKKEFQTLSSQFHGTVAGRILESIRNVFEQLIIQSDLCLSGLEPKDCEVLSGFLFVRYILITRAMMGSLAKIAEGLILPFESRSWLFNMDALQRLFEENEFLTSTQDFVSTVVQDVILKPTLKLLTQKLPKSLCTDYVPSCVGLVQLPNSGRQSYSLCGMFLRSVFQSGVVYADDFHELEALTWELLKGHAKESLLSMGNVSLEELEIDLADFEEAVTRFEYLHENDLNLNPDIPSLRKEIIFDFETHFSIFQENLSNLESLLESMNSVSAYMSNDVADNRIYVIEDEIAQTEAFIDICQNIVEFEKSRAPYPLLFPPIQKALLTMIDLEIFLSRKQKSKKALKRKVEDISSLLEYIEDNRGRSDEDYAARLNAVVKPLIGYLDSGRNVFKRLHSASERVLRGYKELDLTDDFHNSLKMFWSLWSQLSGHLRKWIESSKKTFLIERWQPDSVEIVAKDCLAAYERMKKILGQIFQLLDILQQAPDVIKETSDSLDSSSIDGPDGIAIEAENIDFADDQESSDDDGIDTNALDELRNGSQKAQVSVNEAREANDKNRRSGKKNMQALLVLERIHEKLIGLDDASKDGAVLSVSAQPSTTKLSRSHPLSQKLQKMLGHSLDGIETKSALEALDSFYYGDNRRDPINVAHLNLKADLDSKAMSGYRDFLSSFETVLACVNAVESDLESVNQTYLEMESMLKIAKSDSAMLLAQTRDLKLLREQTISKKTAVDGFLRRFTPSDSEIDILTTSSDLTETFFAAMNRLIQINDDCNSVLMQENQKAGNEIIESVAIYQEKGYAKLHSWIQIQQLPLFKRETPEVSKLMRKAMSTLKARPSLFQSCVDEISLIRQTVLVQFFMDALTRGGPSGLPRPIELVAHDPVRYVGDMLAWLHQASVGERELVEGLFSGDASVSMNDDIFSVLSLGLLSTKPEAMLVILDVCTKNTVPPLKARIDEVLASNLTPSVSYKISTTIQFYSHTIGKVIGEKSGLVSYLGAAYDKTFKVFLDTLKAQGVRMTAFVQKPGRELTPPPVLKEAVLQLRELMASYESSLMMQTSDDTNGEEGFSQIMAVALDPILTLCTNGTATLGKFENAVYIANCLFFIQSAIALYEFTATRVESITSQIEAQIQILIDEQSQIIIKQSGLSPLLEALDEHSGKIPLALVPALDARAIMAAMSNLDVYLCTAGFEAHSRLSLLLSTQHRERSLDGGFSAFLESYKRLHDAVMDPVNKYEFPSTIIRSIGEIQTLLVV
ncbi:Serine/threonine-protein kinase smg1 [Entophlyctis sp. JEL0112]|nr:Serine/threonine-protein kinase smg1 [Entophlyctis sp. JEL0112]